MVAVSCFGHKLITYISKLAAVIPMHERLIRSLHRMAVGLSRKIQGQAT